MTGAITSRRVTWLTVALIACLLPLLVSDLVSGQASSRDQRRRTRFTPTTTQVDPEVSSSLAAAAAPAQAPAGFSNVTNGFDPQGPDFNTLNEDTAVALRSFNDNRFTFEETETVADGLGPTYNAQSCRECHQNIVTGGASQVTVLRAGHLTGGQFFESQGGSLIQSRATHPDASENLTAADNIRAFRISPNTLGDGFIEAISNTTLLNIRSAQPSTMRGVAVVVPVLEANGVGRIGRFGWKGQHASLESFAADAYLNEMGITSPLLPDENTANGRDVAPYDTTSDPEDDGDDIKAFANFMRATMVPPRGAITATVTSGEQVFARIGCATCHVGSITTAPANTSINGGTMVVPAALANKVIHPYSDFLLHDVGTGDGIPIQPTAEFANTANRMRTAPLWGLRTRNRMMHDGTALTPEDAILRHGGQASGVTTRYRALSATEKSQLVAFLNSL